MQTRTGIGQDSHAFENNPGKILMLGGIAFGTEAGLQGNSDSDVVLHALTNAISGITAVNVLGPVADALCNSGVTDSAQYVRKAMESLDGWKIAHASISIEAKLPKLAPKMEAMRARIGEILGLPPGAVGITATSGEGLTPFGQGKGIQCTAVVTARKAGLDGATGPEGAQSDGL